MKRAQRRKYHYIYKTVNILNGKFYIGMHSTDNLDDGYIGSGKRLWYSINKHGKENHVQEILEFLPDRETLANREAELVNSAMLENVMCMNLKPGGIGGGCSSFTPEQANRFYVSGAIAANKIRSARHSEKLKTDKVYAAKYSATLSAALSGENASFFGRKHTEDTKRKMSESQAGNQVGEKNSQFGTCWVSKIDNGTHKIKISELEEYLSNGWARGRKLNRELKIMTNDFHDVMMADIRAFAEKVAGVLPPQIKIDLKNRLIHVFSFDVRMIEDIVKEFTTDYSISACISPTYMACFDFGDSADISTVAIALKMHFNNHH